MLKKKKLKRKSDLYRLEYLFGDKYYVETLKITPQDI
jgi:hypothetical protein